MNLERILKKLPRNKTINSKNNLKILHIITSGVNAGGITKFVINTMASIVEQNDVDCYVLSPISVNKSLQNIFENSKLKLVEIKGRTKNPIGYFFKLRYYIKKNNFDIVHIHGSSALMTVELLAAKLAEVEVRIVHSHNITCDYKLLHKILNPLFQKLYTNALACSKDAGEWLFGNRDFTIIYNGIDLQKFKFSLEDRDKIRRELGITENNLVIGHIGHFNKQKNHTFLVDIFQKLEKIEGDARLLLIGTGKLEESIKDKIASLNLSEKVFFIGNVDDVYRYFSAMDIFVLPSLFEGFSIVLAESQANSLLSFTSNTTPKAVALTSKVRYLSLDKGADFWVEEILKYGENKRELSEEEQNNLKSFDIHNISNIMYNYYLDILKEK